MEPLRLKIHDFLSYGDETIDLSGIYCAALVGDNGSGKSSCLEAILFALFGQGGKAGKKELDCFVRRKTEEARVDLEFSLENRTYRVVRARNKAKDKSALAFFILGDEGQWMPLGKGTIADTQRIIEETIRMDYTTFTASAMVLQNQSGVFTKEMKDSERKETLGKILGLDVWDRLEERAKASLQSVEGEAAVLEAEAKHLAETAAAGEAVAEEAEALRGAQARLDLRIAENTAAADECLKAMGHKPELERRLRELKGQYEKTRQELDEVRNRLKHLSELRAGLVRRTEELAGILANEGAVAEAEQKERSLLEALSVHDAANARHMALSRECGEAERLLEKAKGIRHGEMERLKAEAGAARSEAGKEGEARARLAARLDGLEEILKSQQSIAAAVAEEESLLKALDVLETRNAEYMRQAEELARLERIAERARGRVKAESDRIGVRLDEARKQASVLGEVPCDDGLKGKCPLLSMAREAQEAVAKLETASSAIPGEKSIPEVAAVDAARQSLAGIGYDAALHGKTREALAAVRRVTAGKEKMAAAVAERKAVLEAMQACDAARESAARRAAVLEGKLEALSEKQAAFPEEAAVRAAREAVRSVGYDEPAHVAVRHALSEARKIAAGRSAIASATSESRSIRSRMEEADLEERQMRERETRLSTDLAAVVAEGKTVSAEYGTMKAVAERLAELRKTGDTLRKEKEQGQNALGRFEKTMEAGKKAASELAPVRSRLASLSMEASVLGVLKNACGKKGGVPAMILENAVPEIERLANAMLSRMAGGRLSIRMDLQAETKTGKNLQECLKIIVMDNGEEGPYQTYSGAEQFQVDVALRVALSKFLAHRSGAEIRFFVLDEGLGACDETNRHAVMDALKVVSAEFGKTIVITHLAALQDALPQRIEVTRPNGGGSRVQVLA